MEQGRHQKSDILPDFTVDSESAVQLWCSSIDLASRRSLAEPVVNDPDGDNQQSSAQPSIWMVAKAESEHASSTDESSSSSEYESEDEEVDEEPEEGEVDEEDEEHEKEANEHGNEEEDSEDESESESSSDASTISTVKKATLRAIHKHALAHKDADAINAERFIYRVLTQLGHPREDFGRYEYSMGETFGLPNRNIVLQTIMAARLEEIDRQKSQVEACYRKYMSALDYHNMATGQTISDMEHLANLFNGAGIPAEQQQEPTPEQKDVQAISLE